MKKKILCNLLTLQEKPLHPCINEPKNLRKSSIVKVYPSSKEEPYEIEIERHQTIELIFGDKLKSVSGTVFFKFTRRPDSKTFILSPDYESSGDSKYRSELIVDEETTKLKTNQNIKVPKDIKNLINNKTI